MTKYLPNKEKGTEWEVLFLNTNPIFSDDTISGKQWKRERSLNKKQQQQQNIISMGVDGNFFLLLVFLCVYVWD